MTMNGGISMSTQWITVDGNEAAARIAYKTNDVIAIYPITPASPMGEFADAWAASGKRNIFGAVPRVVQMQSEAGAAGAVHGALQAGALATTFTASQGLLLMLPNMYKIAGELHSAVFHIAARAVATHALSIFGDHSDVMAARQTGWGMLFSSSVQEAMDLALIAQAATLRARVPFLHVFDGFRTSHEVAKIQDISDDDIRALIDESLVRRHRARGVSPDRPDVRGTAQNPDVFFQSREGANPYYLATPHIVEQVMEEFAERVGRRYELFSYSGHPEAERVIILMGSGCETAEETVSALVQQGEKVGVVKVRLFRPFSADHLIRALPPTVTRIAVLDRTKEPGSAGEPLYQDVVTAINQFAVDGHLATLPLVVGGRYGLASKEFTPAMVKGVFDHLKAERPRHNFTVGIVDDVTHTSIPYDPTFSTEARDGVINAIFWGLGSDGTVSANKNSIKIIGESTPNYAQGYFVYDSRKSGSVTVSHLRFGKEKIQSAYEVQQADFVGVHQFDFVYRYDVLGRAKPGATVLINSPYPPEKTWDRLPREVQQTVIEKGLKLYVIDAYSVAEKAGVGKRINTVMQTCFFALSGVLPKEEAIPKIKEFVRKSYGKRGEAIVQANFRAIDEATANLHPLPVPAAVTSQQSRIAPVPPEAPDFVQRVTAPLLAGRGDELPVSALPADGIYPVGTTQWEKRSIASEVPVWDPDLCIQCGKCVFVCPHAAIRSNVYDAALLDDAPAGFKSAPARWRGMKDRRYTLQVAVEDCTGCALCVEACPVVDKKTGRKALYMEPQEPLVEAERENFKFFLSLPAIDPVPNGFKFDNVKDVQLLQPLFEFSGACAGCGETPYLRLLSQLFGDRAVIANATGCSSIYGGNLPTTPWTTNRHGRGPAWSNSLFEDNAEYGLGMRLALDERASRARRLVRELSGVIGEALAADIVSTRREEHVLMRERVEELKKRLRSALEDESLKERHDAISELLEVADDLVPRSVWIVGGDGWAYDIGFGGLDHVLATGEDVNILVLDTEVYSNTGGQASKATPRGAIAKFAAKGRETSKKDLAMMAIQYGNVYVATVAMGYDDRQTLKAFLEAESYDGPSLIIAYSHCIAHGIDMTKGLEQQRLAVQSGHWPLFRYDPRREQPLTLDSKEPSIPLAEYLYREPRYEALRRSEPELAAKLLQAAENDVRARWRRYADMAARQAVEVTS
jgi:pyruvate:ferredoxin (flavodoxin) oxidoreductase, homodimeric